MDQKYLVSVENGAGSLSNTEIGKKTLDMRISSEYSCNPDWFLFSPGGKNMNLGNRDTKVGD